MTRRLRMETLEDRRVLNGTMELVKNINPAAGGGSNPDNFVDVGGTMYFTAVESAGALRQLWRTDPTLGAVKLTGVAIGAPAMDVSNVTSSGGRVYFTTMTSAVGTELWTSDGTVEGTTSLKLLSSDSDSRGLAAPVDVNGTLYFNALVDLWKTDGTTEGTALVKTGVGATSARLGVGDQLFYVRNTELWVSNGTPEGTTSIAVLTAIANLTAMGDRLYFTATTPAGNELWTSDGTSAGTTMVKDIYTFSNNSSNPKFLTVVGDTLYFQATDLQTGAELWKSDGTEAGTVRVADIQTGVFGSTPQNLAAVGDKLYFAASRSGFSDYELWMSDGTADGTKLVKDIGPSGNPGAPFDVTDVGGVAYFVANDSGPLTSRHSVWRSDGTAAGTTRATYVNFNGTGSSTTLGKLKYVGGSLYFVGTYYDQEFGPSTDGQELWKLDGAKGDATVFADAANGLSNLALNLAVVNGTVYFSMDDALGNELWRSDGTLAGTKRVRDIWTGGGDGISGTTSASFTASGGKLYFVAKDNGTTGGGALFVSDGTTAGTTRLTSGSLPVGVTGAEQLMDFGGALLFVGYDAEGGRELWRSDGTVAGTARVKDIWPGVDDASILMLGVLDGIAYFYAVDGEHESELWRSDGTEAGTTRVTDVTSGNGAFRGGGAAVLGDKLYFLAREGGATPQLWAIDNSATEPTAVTAPGVLSLPLSHEKMISARGRIYFSTISGLWQSDGTAAGTAPLHPEGDNVHNITASGGVVYFGVSGAAGHVELWRVNAAGTGTELVKAFDFTPASTGTKLSYLTDLDGTLYFVADDAARGREVWKSDGTTAGTMLAVDTAPGTADGTPSHLTAADGVLYFFSRGLAWALPGASPAGDFDNNSRVAGGDFLAWQRTFGGGAGFAFDGADGNGDSQVDGEDLALWANSFGGLGSTEGKAVAVSTTRTAAIDAALADAAQAMLSPSADESWVPKRRRAFYRPR